MTLIDLLSKKQCFKLICGAGNEDPAEIEKLVAVYAKAGVHFFDLSANEEIVKAARNGINRVIKKPHRKEYFLCVSVGMEGDPHLRKAVIDLDKCRGCGSCSFACLQKAIKKTVRDDKTKYMVIESRCIGCGACFKNCAFGAIKFVHKYRDLNKILPSLMKYDLASIELHAITEDEDSAFKEWQIINKYFQGTLSLCLGRTHVSDTQLVNRIKRFIADRNEFTTIIQADGAPMSGGSSNVNNTTLQALATADIVQKAKLPVWLLMSGGTNCETTRLAKKFEISAHGVSIGSYARKIIKEEITRDDFFENKEVFNRAYKIAKKLVDKSLVYLK